MANSKNDMNFHNDAGTYTYDTSATFNGSYTNANNAGITVNIVNGAAISVDNLNLNQSTLNIRNGTFTVRNDADLNSGVLNVSGTLIVADNTNLNSAKINITGGTVNLQGNISNNDGVVVDFNKNPNGTLIIAGPNEDDDLESVTIRNYVYGNTIKVNYDNDLQANATLSTSYDQKNHTLTVVANGRPILELKDFYEGDSRTPTATTETRGNDVYLVLSCFLAGSMIRTPSGDVAVETMQAGDDLVAYVAGEEVTRRVTWAGRLRCDVQPHLPDDEAGYPVRILKDAIAEGVPFKDMLVTSEHCLLLNGCFVPVRMLVNGRSISYDKSITSYEFFHVETDNHSVIMADGVLTESYLDTGNRSTFSQTGKIVTFTPSRHLTWNDAAAPLAVARDFVEPLFREIETRAVQAGRAAQAEVPMLSDDANLHLVTDTGIVIRQARRTDDRVMFMIPAGVRAVRIVSNTSRLADVIGPFVDDRRVLGVLVGDAVLFESQDTRTLNAHLLDAGLAGWNNVEDGHVRWTAGNAELSLGDRAPGSLALLALKVRDAGPYVVATPRDAQAALTA